jgi:mono/diheme cytochrome c family protein
MTIMATNAFRYLSQSDLDSIVAYLHSVPASESGVEPDSSLTYLAMVMLPLGALPIKDVPDIGPPPYVEPAASFACGEYLANVFDCALCHGDDLAGGPGDCSRSDRTWRERKSGRPSSSSARCERVRPRTARC